MDDLIKTLGFRLSPTEVEDVIVQATRSGRRIQDEPIRVEVIGREEIEEKLLMTPGNIAMLVNETGGVRVQTTSPALGAFLHNAATVAVAANALRPYSLPAITSGGSR